MRKSPSTAEALTFFFGPLGAIYASIGFAISHFLITLSLSFLTLFALPLSNKSFANPNYQIGIVIIIVLIWIAYWITISIHAGKVVRAQNKEIDEAKADEERRHKEVLDAIRSSGNPTAKPETT